MRVRASDQRGARALERAVGIPNEKKQSRRFRRGLDRTKSRSAGTNEARTTIFDQLTRLQKMQLARQLGYQSLDSMLAASTVVTLSDGSDWWLTADCRGAWTAWNLCALQIPLCDAAADDSPSEDCAAIVRAGQ